MKIESRILEVWTNELIEEQKEYYSSYYTIYLKLVEARRNAWKTYDRLEQEMIHELYKNYFKSQVEVTSEEHENAYLKLWEDLANLGYVYDKEHFLKTHNNGTPYKINFEGIELVSSEYVKVGNKKVRTFNIISNYFAKKSSLSLLSVIERAHDKNGLATLEKAAEKEVRSYVESLVKRVESRFGKINLVKDSYMSNVERVVFECEEATCYLERILAGGYNIQRLHNRLLIKKLK